jgi:hypothetical protein
MYSPTGIHTTLLQATKANEVERGAAFDNSLGKPVARTHIGPVLLDHLFFAAAAQAFKGKYAVQSNRDCFAIQSVHGRMNPHSRYAEYRFS